MSSRQQVANTLIIDPGSSTIKAGLATETLPAVVFPTVIGQPAKKAGILKKKTVEDTATPLPSHLIGHEALHHINRCTLSYPIERGVIQNWGHAEHMLHHCFSELQIEADETGICITEPPFHPRQNTERLAQTLFEAFNVPQLSVVPSGICALYASGRTTGVVLDSGAGVTHITPVFDSFIVSSASNRIHVGGDDVTAHLRTLLFERGLNFTSPQDLLQVKRMKESSCFLAEDYDAALKAADDSEFLSDVRLPDGQVVQVGKERFRAPEILFSPSILQSEIPSFGELVADAVKGSAIDIRRALVSSIVLCGGNTLFPGFGRRLEDQATKYFPGLFGSVKAIESADRLFSVWAGASVVANLPTFANTIVTRDVYDEHGPSIVRGYNKGHTDDAAADEDPSTLPAEGT